MGYATALASWIAFKGVPLSWTAIVLWLLLGTLALSLHEPQRWVSGLALEWLPFLMFLFLYGLVRNYADRLARTHVMAPIRADRALFHGHDPTIWLQHHLWHGAAHIRWYDYACWVVYMTFFFATLVTAGALWVFAHGRFRRYAVMVSALSALGVITYAAYPAAPPWWASAHGQLAPSTRITSVVWLHSEPSLAHVVSSGQGLADQVAAMPSLHAALTLLIAMYLWRSARWWWRIALAAYPIAMAFTLVYFAEHYVIDIAAGWLYALVVYAAVDRWSARAVRRARRATVRPRPDAIG